MKNIILGYFALIFDLLDLDHFDSFDYYFDFGFDSDSDSDFDYYFDFGFAYFCLT